MECGLILQILTHVGASWKKSFSMFAYVVTILRLAWNLTFQCTDLNSMIEINFPWQHLHPVQISLKSDQSFSSYSTAKFDMHGILLDSRKLDAERPFWGWRRHQRQNLTSVTPLNFWFHEGLTLESRSYLLVLGCLLWPNHFLCLHKRQLRTCGEKAVLRLNEASEAKKLFKWHPLTFDFMKVLYNI